MKSSWHSNFIPPLPPRGGFPLITQKWWKLQSWNLASFSSISLISLERFVPNFSSSALFEIKTRVSLKYFVNDFRNQILACTDNLLFPLDEICPKKIFLVFERESKGYHWILHNQISLGVKFQLILTILIFYSKFAQKDLFSVKNRKSWVLYILIIVVTKFQLKLTLIFWTNFA